MIFWLSFAIGVLFGFFFFFFIGPCFYKNKYYWPSITHCRCCNKRIFAWQKYERAAYECVPHLYEGIPLKDIVLTGFKHVVCCGAAPIEVDFHGVVTKDNNGVTLQVTTNNLTLYPKECFEFGISENLQAWMRGRLD